MSPYTLHPAFYNQPIRLDAEDRQEPITVLHEFFDQCPLAELRQTLWQVMETALQADDTLYDQAAERHRLLWFYRQVEAALEAAWLLSRPTTKK